MRARNGMKVYFSCLLFGVLFLFPLLVRAQPSIFYTDIISGPKSGTNDGPGGCYLSIFGKGFGSSRGSSTVTIGGGAVGAYKYWSDSRVSVQLGASCATGSIVLQTSEGSATGPDQFTVRSGEIYFVATNGSDGTGVVNDVSHPYHDPEYVESLGTFGAGDFIVVRGGTYDLDDGSYQMDSNRWLYPQKSGSNDSPLTFYGYPETDGSYPNIQLDNPSHLLWENYSFVTDWVIANFGITQTVCNDDRSASFFGAGNAAIYCTGEPSPTAFSRGRFVNFNVHGGCGSKVWGANGFSLGRVDNVKIFGLYVHDRSDGGEATDHVLYLSACMHDVEVGWCTLTDQPNSRAILQVHQDSYDCWGLQCFDNIYIHDCEISSSNGQGLMLDGGIADIWIYNNIFYDIKSSIQHDVVDFRLRGGTANVRFYNNTIVTSDGVCWDFGPVNGENETAKFDFRNNICVTDSASNYYNYKDTVDYLGRYTINSTNNLWYGSASGSPPSWDTNPLHANPNLVSSTNLALQSNSPARDAGTNAVSSYVTTDILGISRPQGSAYDIGAYEYDEGSKSSLEPPSIPGNAHIEQ